MEADQGSPAGPGVFPALFFCFNCTADPIEKNYGQTAGCAAEAGTVPAPFIFFPHVLLKSIASRTPDGSHGGFISGPGFSVRRR